MKRKAIQLANRTIVVSLPAKWIKQQGIKKGDEIDIEEKGNRLIIETEKNNSEKNRKIINLNEWGLMKNRIVLNEYLKGIDELELKFRKLNQIKEIKERVVNELIGFEIIKQTPDSITIKEISNSSEQDFDTILRRIFLIIDSSFQELIKSLNNSRKDLTCIISTDLAINKLCYYCIRILNKKGYKNYQKVPALYSIVLLLEQIGDIHKNIAEEIIKKNIKITEKDVESIKSLRNLFEILNKTLFKQKIKYSENFVENYEILKNKLKKDSKINMYLNQIFISLTTINNNLLLITNFD